MHHPAIFRQAIREALAQPAIIFAAVLLVIVAGLLAVGLGMRYDNDALVALTLFGKVFAAESLSVFAARLVPSLSSLMAAVLMFLFIVGSSSVFRAMLNDPLLSIVLTKPVARWSVIASKFAGHAFIVIVLVCVFAIVVWFIFFVKTSGNHAPDALHLAALSFSYEFLIVFAFCSVIAMFVESEAGIALLGLALYFIIAPLLESASGAQGFLVNVVRFIVPPIGPISGMTQELVVVGGSIDPVPLLAALPYVIGFIGLTMVLFTKRDIA
jgi:ABC-type transport system involved in multi-copper enzyme maturation permease subunit